MPRAVPIVANFVVKFVVIDGIAANKATDIAAAIKPYSIAVAPDSSLRNLFILTLQLLLTAHIPPDFAHARLLAGMS